MNIVILKGNLTRDPELRKITGEGGRETQVVNFALAVNRHFTRADGTRDKETTYVNCEAWDSGAGTIHQYVHKGDPLLIKGSLKLDVWEADGKQMSKLKVRVNEFELLYRSPRNDSGEPGPSPQTSSEPPDPAEEARGIPF